jgi:hypothetical protein
MFLVLDMTNHVAKTKFQRLLDPCSDRGNSSFYNMKLIKDFFIIEMKLLKKNY